jgi:cytochrome c-type biogenesis protein CcmF
LDIARKSYRTDYIVLEAIIFPGINLFWIGSILIMIGLSVAMVNRLLQNRRMPA